MHAENKITEQTNFGGVCKVSPTKYRFMFIDFVKVFSLPSAAMLPILEGKVVQAERECAQSEFYIANQIKANSKTG